MDRCLTAYFFHSQPYNEVFIFNVVTALFLRSLHIAVGKEYLTNKIIFTT